MRIGYDEGMKLPQFNLSRMFIATTLVAVGWWLMLELRTPVAALFIARPVVQVEPAAWTWDLLCSGPRRNRSD